ncbi:hypothetical protein OC25_07935 [Pedobacter kyungheensis]|uniref:Uncharacterized protein n=1 Tax=Pedobacter kyungheensis TaxID=1069985 RepID=A0A0C1FQM3_9SPHI|nr:hypothetical protein [Pedobacter kyungheensis]KIA95232.1 hypothetical protein OC25_07935 [Pedobacter kyungheensis]
MNIDKLLTSNVVWKKHPLNAKFFFLKQKDQIVLLRINNFPDEPLFSIIDGLDILDIEDKPAGWKIEW